MPKLSSTVELTKELVARPSVTPDDAGCQELLISRLETAGFEIERMRFGKVDNFWAVHRGGDGPLLCFAGHTDVVPPGPREKWSSDPFEPVVRDGLLYGRGSADMKSGVAAMTTAALEFVGARRNYPGAIGFVITSDEEGPSVDGTQRVVDALRGRGQRADYCVVGEPSSQQVFGDTVRIGRRGSLSGRLSVQGIQGHVAYPDRALNPIHAVFPAFAELAARRWDEGNAHFPPTSFQVSNIQSGTGASNVIPGELDGAVQPALGAGPDTRRTEARRRRRFRSPWASPCDRLARGIAAVLHPARRTDLAGRGCRPRYRRTRARTVDRRRNFGRPFLWFARG